MSFGERLRSARISLNMSQEELGHQLDVTQGAVGRWELSGGFPDTLKLVPLTRILGVSLDWLLEADESPLEKHIEKRKTVRAMELVKILTIALDSEMLTESQIVLLSALIEDFSSSTN